MSCTDAQLAILLEYLEHECIESGELKKCIQIIQLVRRKLLAQIAKSFWS